MSDHERPGESTPADPPRSLHGVRLFEDAAGPEQPERPGVGAAPVVHPQFAVSAPDPFAAQRHPHTGGTGTNTGSDTGTNTGTGTGEATRLPAVPSPYPPPPTRLAGANAHGGSAAPRRRADPTGAARESADVAAGDASREADGTRRGDATLPPPTVVASSGHETGRGVVVAADSVHASASGRRRRSMGEGIDWSLVRAFRQEAANQLTNATIDREGIDDATRHELGRKIILDLLSNHAREADVAGRGGFSPHEQQQLAEAIFDSLFGLGRLQPLVDNPDLENIEIRGYDNVHLVYSDGRIEHGPPVADSDEELIDTLAFLAARSGGSERPFSPNNPDLDLRLPGGARLAASAWTTPRPLVVIRRHRLVDVDLDDLVALDMLDAGMASFLRAAIRSQKSIVVSGAQGAGKTTLVRALCNEIPPLEAIGTIETEFELHLHEMGDRHPRCSPWESRPGSGEKTADGRRLGEVTLDDILYRSLRMNLSRIIVGEVRGKEVIPMFKAMQAGSGSVSTTHAHSAHAAVERLVTCATEAGPQISEAWAYRQIAEHIDIIVQVTLRDSSTMHGQGKRERFVSEVVYVEPGEDARPALTDVYAPGPDGRARPGTMPQGLKDLGRWGFDLNSFVGRGVA